MEDPRRRRRLLRLGVPFLVLSIPAAGFGAHPMATDDTGTVGEGAVEVELSAEAGQPGGPQHQVHAGVGLSLHAGLTERVDLGASLFYETFADPATGWSAGMADPIVDLKLRFFDGDGAALPALGLRLDYRAPSAGAAADSGHDVGGLLLLTWARGASALHLDLGGYAVSLGTGEAGPSLHASIAYEHRVAPELRLGLEAVAESRGARSVDGLTSMAGVFWQAGDTVLSLGAGPTWSRDHGGGWLGTVAVTTTFAGT